MENKLTAKDAFKKIRYELSDMLVGAAFPFMFMLVLGSTVIGFITYIGGGDIALKAVILAVGEAMFIAATVVFARQNGVTAYKKKVFNDGKRGAGSDELKVRLRVGEYAPYKAAIIGFIACVPFIIVNLVYCLSGAKWCEFILSYMFGWAYYPFSLAKLSPWYGNISLIPYIAVHVIAYIIGGNKEKKRQEIIDMQNEMISERGKK